MTHSISPARAFPDAIDSPELVANRLAAIVESSDDAIVSKTLEGIVVTWNAAAERLFGYTASEMVGKSILLLIPPDRHHEEPMILERLRRGERIEHLETIRVRKDGTPVEVSISISPIHGPDGAVVGISKIVRDVGEKAKAQRELREETNRLELLNETGALIASKIGLSEVVQAVCDSATRIVGASFGAFFYNVLDTEGESYLLFALTGAPREAFERFGMPRNTPVFAPTFRGEGVVRSDDITKDPRYGTMSPHHGMPKGHLPVVSYLAVPVTSRSGEVIGGLFFGHAQPGRFTPRHERILLGIAAQAALAIDNARLYEASTQLAAERAQLLEAERKARSVAEHASLTKDQFLSTLSHELRTPLNAILGWAQMLRTQGGLSDVQRRGLDVIERNAQTQTQLVDDLLDMSRIDAGKMRLAIEHVDVSEVVASAIETVMHSADSKGVRVLRTISTDRVMVSGDPTRLRQCVWNLLSNAVKFTKRGGKVHVSVSKVHSHVQIRVSDDGVGIAPDFLPYVFDRFRQADGSTTRTDAGLGLGLTIVKHLVQLHGGTVVAESEGVGSGATFVIALPVAAVTPVPPAPAPKREPQIDELLRGMKILAVDDEPDTREIVQMLLAARGADVVSCESVDTALAALDAQRFDVIVSDVSMPEKDGYALIRALRARPAESGGRTPAVALTAFARADERTRVFRSGFQSHVAKPVDIEELVAVIASLVHR